MMHTPLEAYLNKLLYNIKLCIFSRHQIDNLYVPIHYFTREAKVEEYMKMVIKITIQWAKITDMVKFIPNAKCGLQKVAKVA
jgi:hypothetical protein